MEISVNVTVSTTEALVSALKVARDGDVVQLKAGTYTDIQMYKIQIAGNVTITSADPGNPAVITGMMANQVSGLTFKDLTFFVDPAKNDGAYQIMGSQNLTFDHISMHGSMDNNAQNDKQGLLLLNSKDITITNSEFQQLSYGVTHLNSQGITVTDSFFHDVRTGGVRGGGSSQVTITDNQFRDFHPFEWDHPDAIQFWTTEVKQAASDILISGNVIMRGGGAPIQGVFMRDEQGIYPYKNVTITDNLIVGSLWNGIAVGHGENVKVTNNVVAGLTDQESWITVNGSTGVTVSGNQATRYLYENNKNQVDTGNVTITAPTDGGKALLSAWTASHSDEPVTTTANFATAGDLAQRAIDALRSVVISVTGTEGSDNLYSDATRNSLMKAGGGNDSLFAIGSGSHTMVGGAGNDTYYLKTGSETIVEDANGGTDQVVSSANHTLAANVENLRMEGAATIGTGNALDNRIQGSGNNDTISGLGGNDVLQGEGGNDSLIGGDGADTLYAGAGDDTVTGDAGADIVSGGAGNDSLAGGAGNDSLQGDGGADTMSGGAGVDVFTFGTGDLGAADRITDFSSADKDKLALSTIDANVTKAGDQAFAFIGGQAFHNVAGELRFEVVGNQGVLSGDVNGDGIADLRIYLDGVKSLTTSDIFL